jgi:DNA-binding PadR family transcriptional regulator
MHICAAQQSGLAGEETFMAIDRKRGGLDSQLAVRAVEFHILLSLTVGERHGYGIIQDIQARGETSVPDVGTMYRALARMVESRLIETAARRPAPDAGHERRNYYRITEAGLRVARAEARRLEALTRAARIGGLLAKATK